MLHIFELTLKINGIVLSVCVHLFLFLTETLRGLIRVSLVQLMGPSVSKLVMYSREPLENW